MENYFQLLKDNPLFLGIPEDSLDTVIHCLKGSYHSFRHRTLLFEPGERIPSAGIVLKGSVEVFLSDMNASPLMIHQILPGELFAHALTVSGIEDHTFEIYASSHSEILFLTIPEFTALKNSSCTYRFKVMENLMILIAKKNVEQITRMQILAQKTLRQKLLLYFSLLSQKTHSNTIEIPFNRDKLSYYLACDRSAMSRELSKMQQEGLITYSKNTVTLLSQDIKM